MSSKLSSSPSEPVEPALVGVPQLSSSSSVPVLSVGVVCGVFHSLGFQLPSASSSVFEPSSQVLAVVVQVVAVVPLQLVVRVDSVPLV